MPIALRHVYMRSNWHIVFVLNLLQYYHLITLLLYHFLIMATIDIIILVFVGAGAVLGFMKGFIKQLASLLGLIVGLLAAKALYAPLAEKLCPTVTDSMTVAQILAFVAIWIAVPLAFALVASLLTKAMEAISLGWLNRWLGSGLGALKFLLLASLLIGVIEFIDSDNTMISETKKKESVLYYPMKSFSGIFFPAVKTVTEHIVNKDFV